MAFEHILADFARPDEQIRSKDKPNEPKNEHESKRNMHAS